MSRFEAAESCTGICFFKARADRRRRRCCAKWSDIPDQEFARMERDRFVAGEFVWTGIDYLGEPTPNPTLCRSSFFGICDLCAMPKDRYWLYRSLWNDRRETVHLLPHWNWDGREGEKITVVCYTSGDAAQPTNPLLSTL